MVKVVEGLLNLAYDMTVEPVLEWCSTPYPRDLECEKSFQRLQESRM